MQEYRYLLDIALILLMTKAFGLFLVVYVCHL